MSWNEYNQLKNRETYVPEDEFEMSAYNGQPTFSSGHLNQHGLAKDGNPNIQDTKGRYAMDAMSDHEPIRNKAQRTVGTLRNAVNKHGLRPERPGF